MDGRRVFFIFVFLCVVGSFFGYDFFFSDKEYNIIFITVDALRSDHLGCYGYLRNTSPNLDDFCSESVVFENAYVSWPKTSQSMASIFTSKYSKDTGVDSLWKKVPDDLIFFTEALVDLGFYNVGFAANSNLGVKFNYNQGFSEFYDLWRGKADGGQRFADTADEVTYKVISWLDGNSEDKFFLWAHYIDPHGPYTPPGVFSEKFIDDGLYVTDLNVHSTKIPGYQRLSKEDLVDVDYYVSQYDGEIGFVDDKLGELFDALKSRGLWDSTIIIISADHGESLYEHKYFFEHGRNLYNPTLHVPLIIHHPDMKAGRVSHAVSSLDIAPTIIDFAGGDVESFDFEGRLLFENGDFKPVLSENKRYQSLVEDDLKYILRISTKDVQVYDLDSDYGELRDIAEDVDVDKAMHFISSFFMRDNDSVVSADSVDLDEDTEKQLRELGYLE